MRIQLRKRDQALSAFAIAMLLSASVAFGAEVTPPDLATPLTPGATQEAPPPTAAPAPPRPAPAVSAAPKAKKEVQPIDLNSVSLEDLLNVKVTAAAKMGQKQNEAPGIVTLVKREQFKEYGWYTFNDALYHQAGFFPSRDYDRRTVGSRGLFEGWNNNHILMLMDGVPFNDPMYGTAYTWEITPSFMVKSMEVLRGPGSALYGTNATNGVIALQTYSGRDLRGRAEGSYRLGSFNTSEWNVMTGSAKSRVSYVIAANGFETSGNSYLAYDDSGRTTTSGDLEKDRIRDNRSSRYLFFKAAGQQSLRGFTFQLHDQSWKYQTGHGWLFSIPDQPDAMNEQRKVFVFAYNTPDEKTWTNEFTLKYERKENDWYTRYQPNKGDGYTYGVTEYLDFRFDHYFGRAQTRYNMSRGAALLAGVEVAAFDYKGDRSHYSNTNLNGDYLANPNNEMLPANDALGLITNKPIVNSAVYTQLGTGSWMGPIQFTLGARYDNETIHFDQAKASPAGEGNGTRTFNQLSPRLAAVFTASDNFSIKFLAGKAFRAPAPSELAGVNTWALANNIYQLKPETVTTFELGMDYRIRKSLNFKANAFHTKVEDQIGYNFSQANLSTNIYSATTAGAEMDVNYKEGKWGGFFNYSFSQRLNESIADTTVSASSSTVTWAPSMTGNLGVAYDLSRVFKAAFVGEYMSAVHRRSTDSENATYIDKRQKEIPAWYGLNSNFTYRMTNADIVELAVRNILNTKAYLIKNRDYPFDYQVEGINYYLSYTHTF
jgi:iron complex outermembrane receptor protein